MAIHRSEDWSNAQVAANDYLSELLNTLREHNYDPSLHLSYHREEHHVIIDSAILAKHEDIQELFEQYVDACTIRDHAVARIQNLDKVDIGFE